MSTEHVITPVKTYVTIFVSLLVLTGVTYLVATQDFGWANTPIALAVALLKASLVIVYFMGLRYNTTLTKTVAIAGFGWLFILFILTLNDFKVIGERVPLLGDMKPFGKYGMAHLIRFGGIRPMMKMLLERGLLHGDCLTVSGETIAESLKNVAHYPSYPDKQDVIRPWDQPIKKETHLRVLHGNLAPGGAVGKITGATVGDTTGVVTITGSSAATSVGAAVTVTLSPSTTTGGTLTWTCSGTPTKYLPGSCRG